MGSGRVIDEPNWSVEEEAKRMFEALLRAAAAPIEMAPPFNVADPVNVFVPVRVNVPVLAFWMPPDPEMAPAMAPLKLCVSRVARAPELTAIGMLEGRVKLDPNWKVLEPGKEIPDVDWIAARELAFSVPVPMVVAPV